MDDQTPLLEMLHQLENEIDEIKKQLDPIQGGWLRQLGRGIRRTYEWINTNWGFLAFLFAVLVTFWVYARYGVGYFEAQNTLSLTKRSSESYRKLGDQLILYGEFPAARDAYDAAIKINESNLEARRGLLTTDVLEPPSGRTSIIPEVEEAKIDHLNQLLKGDADEGIVGLFNRITSLLHLKTDKPDRTYIVSYFRGVRYERQRNYQCAKHFYEESFKQNKDFIYGYICLGYANILAGDPIYSPIATLNEALQHKRSGLALNNLGYCHMLQRDFEAAKKNFQDALTVSPYLETYINLGDAYRYQGDVKQALDYHRLALELLETQNEKEYSVKGPLAINFMPKESGDTETSRNYITIDDLDHKRMLVYYELSFDYALKMDLKKADEAFGQASVIDRDRTYQPFVKNKIESIEHLSQAPISETSKRWFKKTRQGLPDAPPPPPIQTNSSLKCE
jgi:tetratricopeptide (TPR) repeat protein